MDCFKRTHFGGQNKSEKNWAGGCFKTSEKTWGWGGKWSNLGHIFKVETMGFVKGINK